MLGAADAGWQSLDHIGADRRSTVCKKSSSAVAAVQENTTHYKSVGYHRAGTVLGRDNMSSPGEKQISDGILTPWNTHA